MRCYLVEKRCGEYIPANDYYQSTLDWDSYLLVMDEQYREMIETSVNETKDALEKLGVLEDEIIEESKKLNKYNYEN